MKKSILIIGAGQGLSQKVAEKFAAEGFSINLISRSKENLEKIKQELKIKNIDIDYANADAGNADQLTQAIKSLPDFKKGFDAVLYNAAVLKATDILEETSESLSQDFAVNVANALHTLQINFDGLKQKKGTFLLTGGGFALHPSADFGSLSIGKAGLRNLAFQLHERLKEYDIYVGLLTVAGFIKSDSDTHSPALLADLYWNLYNNRNAIEIQQ